MTTKKIKTKDRKERTKEEKHDYVSVVYVAFLLMVEGNGKKENFF